MTHSIFVSHSAREIKEQRELRQCLNTELEQRGYRTFLDEADLDAGDLWRPKIYRALAECDAAVLLLSPEALKSKWVHTESTVLTWRSELRAHFGRRLTLIPVLLGGVDPKRLTDPAPPGEYAFDHLRTTESQAIVEPFEEGCDIAEVAARIADRFPSLAPGGRDPMTQWATKVSRWLRPVDEGFLGEVAEVLGVPEGDWLSDSDRLTLATALLFADARSTVVDDGLESVFDDAEEALKILLDDQNITGKRELVDNIVPGTIPYAASMGVVEALTQRSGDRIALVDVATGETAKRIVQRATCCQRDVLIELPPSAQTSEEAYAEILAKMQQRAGFRKPLKPGDLSESSKFQIVILLERHDDGMSGTVVAELVRRLRENFKPVLVVIAVGKRSKDIHALGLGSAEVIETTIDPELEEAMNQAIRRLNNELLRANQLAGERG